MTEHGLRRLWIAAILALTAMIIAASLAPQPLLPGNVLSDKAAHALAYLALALLGSGIASPERLWRTMLRCFLLGAALELAQAVMTVNRVGEWGDLFADATGILAAWLIAGGGRAGWGLRAAAWVDRRRSS